MADPTELIGTWSFQRLISDLEEDDISQATGVLELSRDGSELIHWTERATLSHAGRKLPATRDLRIERATDGWHVKFDDGRYFHPWTPGEKLTHHCRADLYEGTIDLGEAAEPITSWRLTWRVRGPRKDLLIDTQLTSATP